MREARLDQWVSAMDGAFPAAMRSLHTAEVADVAGANWDDRVSAPYFTALGAGGERHGVWQWVAHAQVAGLQRFVILQIAIDASDNGDPTLGACPAWTVAAASNTVHFTSRLVAHGVLDDVENLQGFVQRHAFDAAVRAVSLTPASLDGTYVDPAALTRWRRGRGRRLQRRLGQR